MAQEETLLIEATEGEDHVATLKVQVPAARLEKAKGAAARRIARRVAIPGFRSGKAPYSVVEKRFGADTIFDEAAELLAGDVYRETLDRTDLEIVGKADWEVADRDPLTFRFRAPLKPMVKLGDYTRFRVSPRENSVGEEDVEKVLEALRREQGEWSPVERAAADGDLILLHGRGVLDGREVVTLDGAEYGLELGSGNPVEGFPEMLEGMEVGETRTFDLTHPASYPDPELAGRTVSFEINLRGVKGLELPPLDDSLARSVGDFETLPDLRARIREVLEREAEIAEQERAADLVLGAIVNDSEIRYPEVLLEREIESAEKEYAELLAQRGFTLERYVEVTGKTREGIRQELRRGADSRLRRGLVLAEISDLEGISVEEEEAEAEAQAIAQGYGDHAETVAKALTSGEPGRAIRSRLFGRKMLERLAEIGQSDDPGERVSVPQADEDGEGKEPSDDGSPILTPAGQTTR